MPTSPYDYISYTDNIRHVLQSRILIEITQDGQHDVTLRALEAQLYKKKLITTCTAIRQYDFYSPDNILIWPEEKERLDGFIQSDTPFVPIENMTTYTFEHWIKGFK